MMESNNQEDRPESPKKKVRPSSTTNLIPVAHSLESTDSISNGLEDQHKLINEVAPTRKGRLFVAHLSSERTEAAESSREDPSIQEEVVSSSENSTSTAQNPVPSIGDADSLTNDPKDSDHDQLDAEESAQLSRSTKGDPEEK